MKKNDMARYIDAELFEKRLMELFMEPRYMHDEDNYYTAMSIAIDEIRHASAADVVPKSELEKLSIELLHAKEDYGDLFATLVRVKTDVAREIFESIEECIYLYYNKNDYTMPNIEEDITELKKKYTEEHNDEIY